MKENIQKLLGLDSPSNYQISKSIGVAQSTLSDYATGKSDIGNMKLDHAIKLNNYYEVMVMMDKLMINKEEIEKAKNEFNTWRGNAVVWVDFEDGKVWTDVEDIPSYHAETIFPIIGKDGLIDPNAKYSVDRLVRLANLKKEYLDNGENDLLINSLDMHDI